MSQKVRREIDKLVGNPLSYVTTRVESYFNETLLATGSGFVLEYGKRYFLITNWHNVTGRHAITGKCLSPAAAVPFSIKFHVCVMEERHDGGLNIDFTPIEVKLYIEDDIERPVWADGRAIEEHSDFAVFLIDDHIVKLDRTRMGIASILGGKMAIRANAKPQGETLGRGSKGDLSYYFPVAGSSVFILGYPGKSLFTGVFPIWKTAYIASEPLSPVTLHGTCSNNVILVDALTRGGMSGSPVVIFPRPDDIFLMDDGTPFSPPLGQPVLLGIYAGREDVTKDEAELALGRVWKSSSIEYVAMQM